MGGFGSGRYTRLNTKTRVEEALGLDVRTLQREGKLRPGPAFFRRWLCDGREVARRAFLPGPDALTVLREGKPAEFLRLEWTPCHYGGARPWWRCPACDGRCALVYDAVGIFACRQCNDLKHRTTQENRGNRLILKAQRLGARMGRRSLCDPGQGKPYRMHWRTYVRLRRRFEAAYAAGLEAWNVEMNAALSALSAKSRRG